MLLQDAINLITPGLNQPADITCWADLGCGTGLFSMALSTLLKEGSTIHAVDADNSSLNKVKASNGIHLEKIVANFERGELPLHELDGLLMANSLHYVQDKAKFLTKALKWLKKDGTILLVEYDTDQPNTWVPYPISFSSAEKFFSAAPYKSIKKIGAQTSRYQRAGMYAARIQL